MTYSLIFYIFSLILVLFAISVVTVKNSVYSVFSLIGCFIATAGLFIIIGAEYIAMTLIIVYVGAVAVLFLFVVMMLDIKKTDISKNYLKYLPIIGLIFFTLLADLYLLFDKSLKAPLNFIKISLPINNNITNAKSIGLVLYTDYLIAFQLAGLILFTSMISSITLTLRNDKISLKQNPTRQLKHDKSNSIKLVKVEIGKGA